MPISPSRKPSVKPPPPESSRFLAPLIFAALLAVSSIVLITLPASLVGHVVPPIVKAAEFSGSVWHGSAGKLQIDGRDAGAIEWHVRPWSLLALTLDADVHWVDTSFLLDATLRLDRHRLTARNVEGGGPIDDLAGLGLGTGWHGVTHFRLSELVLAFPPGEAGGTAGVLALAGDADVADLSSPQIAGGVELGGFALHVPSNGVTSDGDLAATLEDTGGPLELHATIQFSPSRHTGLLSGALRARPGAAPALVAQVDNLAQLHARDAQGRIPVDLEFTL